MRRTHLRRHDNIAKRLLVHMGGFNLGLVMRKLTGVGKPRRLQGLFSSIFDLILSVWNVLATICGNFTKPDQRMATPGANAHGRMNAGADHANKGLKPRAASLDILTGLSFSEAAAWHEPHCRTRATDILCCYGTIQSRQATLPSH